MTSRTTSGSTVCVVSSVYGKTSISGQDITFDGFVKRQLQSTLHRVQSDAYGRSSIVDPRIPGKSPTPLEPITPHEKSFSYTQNLWALIVRVCVYVVGYIMY
jgi:hypothetical protein